MKHESIDEYIVDNELNLDLVIDNYTHYINKVINNMVGNNLNIQDKEEILIDTFFILWKNYKNNKEIKVLDSYLAGISRNLIKNKLKSNKILVSFDDIEMLEKYSVSNNIDDDYQVGLLYKSINKLSKLEQDIINLYYYSSKSVKEIAQILNMSETNVKIRLFRIRKKLNKETINVLRNVIKFNREQKPENKIHILSCSWGGKQKYSPEITVLLNQLEKDGVKIILCGSDYVKEATLSGRDFMPCNNPDMTDIQPDVQNAGNELLHALNMSFNTDKVIGIPTNMRTTPLESNGWQYRISGGESSSAPYIAGVYACALQGNQLFMTRPNWQQELNDMLKSTAIQTEQGNYMINPSGIRDEISKIVKQMEMTIIKQHSNQNGGY